MRERILAIVGAVALVAVAFVVRTALTDDDTAGGAGGGGGGDRPVVACTPDLLPVCEALADDGRIAADPPTLDLGGEAMTDPAIDGWITWDPAPGIADIDHEGAWASSRPLGDSALAVTGGPGDQAVLLEGCPDGGTTWSWACLAVPGPAIGIGTGLTAESLTRLHPLALALVPADSDVRDISDSALTDLIDSPPVGQARFPEQVRVILTQRGALNVLVGPKGALDDAGLRSQVPTPAASVAVVLAERDDGDELLGDAFEAEAVAAALRAAGVTPGEGTLAPVERAGELYAIREKVG